MAEEKVKPRKPPKTRKSTIRREEMLAQYRDPDARALRLARLEAIEDEILQRSSQILLATLSYSEVAPDQALPPPDWVAEWGKEGAMQRLAVAKAGWLPNSQAPSATHIAARIVAGISRARAQDPEPGKSSVNVSIALPAPTSATFPGSRNLPTKDIE